MSAIPALTLVQRRFLLTAVCFFLPSFGLGTAAGFLPATTNMNSDILSSHRPPANFLEEKYKNKKLTPLQRRIISDYQPTYRQAISSKPTILSLHGGFSLLPLADFAHNPIYTGLGQFVAVDMLVGLFISMWSSSHLHLDLIGTGVFAFVAWRHMWSPAAHVRLSARAVVLWATKLALFLTVRACQNHKDGRLTELLSSSSGMIQFWFITLLWNVLTSLPMLLGWTSDRSNPVALNLGGALFIVGCTVETLADAQKWLFKQNPQNAGQFCNVGVWQYSQHPNLFGNLLLWLGIFIMNVPALVDPLPLAVVSKMSNGSLSLLPRVGWQLWRVRKLALASLSPLFLWSLFSGQARGTVTNAAALARAKYGSNPLYESYLEGTPLIIPNLSRVISSLLGNNQRGGSEGGEL